MTEELLIIKRLPEWQPAIKYSCFCEPDEADIREPEVARQVMVSVGIETSAFRFVWLALFLLRPVFRVQYLI